MRASVRRRQFEERAGGQHAERDAGLHVEDAGPVQAVAVAMQRHSLELADTPDGVEVTEKHHLPRADAEFGAEVIACGGGRIDARAPSAVRRLASSPPQRSTAAFSSVGDSMRTSASMVSSSQGSCRPRQ